MLPNYSYYSYTIFSLKNNNYFKNNNNEQLSFFKFLSIFDIGVLVTGV